MTPNKYMKQEREKNLLYTPFQEINKVNSPPFQGIIGGKDSKKILLCPDYLIKAGQVSIFQNSFAVQIHIFHRKFEAQMKIFRWETADFCEITEKRTWKKVVKHSDDTGKYTGDPGEIVICKKTLEIE